MFATLFTKTHNKMVLDTPISLFRSAKSTEPVTGTLRQFLFSQKYENQVIEIRQCGDKTMRDTLKKTLPAATISGTFLVRNINGLLKYNGLICLDFDGKDNPNYTPWEMKTFLMGIEETVYAGLSVSGTGVFAIIATDNDDPTKHGVLVDYIGELLLKAGIYYDRSCKDVCRLRFVSSDAGAYINPDAPLFPAKNIIAELEARDMARPPRPIKVRRNEPETNQTSFKKVEALVQKIEERRADITSDYSEWLYIAFALANELGPEGEDLFHRISQYNPKYNPQETGKKYQNALQTTGGRVKIGTFFAISNKHGIRLK
jgi:hypothetical protein